MRNPFKTDMPVVSGAFSPAASVVPNDTDTHQHLNAIELDNQIYPDTPQNTYRGEVGDIIQTDRPQYAGADERVIFTKPDSLPGYKFLAPAPGSTDLAEPRDFNSVPGTSYLNYMVGPVSGNAMDHYQDGNQQQTLATPPGATGPVKGGQDYASIVATATFQAAFAEYSNAASDQAIVSAI